MVGDLSSGSSIITFFILNATDRTSAPVPVLAALVVMAISSVNIQEVDSYPVSASMSGILFSGVSDIIFSISFLDNCARYIW